MKVKLYYRSFSFSSLSRLSDNFDCSSSYMNQQSETKTAIDNNNITITWILKLVRKSIPNKTKINRIKTKQVNKRTDLFIPGWKIESTIPCNIFCSLIFLFSLSSKTIKK